MEHPKNASAAYSRIAVLSAHLTGGPVSQEHSLNCSDCSAPSYARAAAVDAQFARPATQVRLDRWLHPFARLCTPVPRHAQGLDSNSSERKPSHVLPRLAGPAFQPTKAGKYLKYTERAAAQPRFARPCEKKEELSPALVQPSRIRDMPQVNVLNSKAGYQLEMALPGVSAGDLRLELQGTDLIITGKQAMTGTSMKSVSLSPAGTFRAYWKLPSEVETNSIRAHLLNGLLRIKARKQVLC